MDSEKERKAMPIAMAGVMSGQSRDQIRDKLCAAGLTPPEANDFLIRILAATDSAQVSLGRTASEVGFKIHKTLEKKEAVSSSDTTVYFEVPISTGDRFLCSDNSCSCTDQMKLEPGKTGFLYIGEDVVSMRKDALSWSELQRKLTAMQMRSGADMLIAGGVVNPIFMCEQGARLRDLDLGVAGVDAAHWIKTGLCPLRPTPTTKRWWQFWK